MVIADTDFLSSIVKINRIDIILKAFKTKFIIIPGAVLHELEKAPFFNAISSLINEGKLVIKNAKFDASEELGDGELGCISLAKCTGEIILMSDQLAVRHAESSGIIALDMPTFLLYCKRQKIVPENELKEIIYDLKKKDYYEFSDETKRKLLD